MQLSDLRKEVKSYSLNLLAMIEISYSLNTLYVRVKFANLTSFIAFRFEILYCLFCYPNSFAKIGKNSVNKINSFLK